MKDALRVTASEPALGPGDGIDWSKYDKGSDALDQQGPGGRRVAGHIG